MRVCGCGRSVKASNGWVHRLWGGDWRSLVSLMLLLCAMGAFIFSVCYTMWEHPNRIICAGQLPKRHLLATWPWISQPSKCSKINSHSLQITQTPIFCYRSTDKDILPGCLCDLESVLEGKVWNLGVLDSEHELYVSWLFIIYKIRKYLDICLVKCLWYFEDSLEKCHCWLQYPDRAFLKAWH